MAHDWVLKSLLSKNNHSGSLSPPTTALFPYLLRLMYWWAIHTAGLDRLNSSHSSVHRYLTSKLSTPLKLYSSSHWWCSYWQILRPFLSLYLISYSLLMTHSLELCILLASMTLLYPGSDSSFFLAISSSIHHLKLGLPYDSILGLLFFIPNMLVLGNTNGQIWILVSSSVNWG